jgi:hypothetical protein
MISRIDGSGGSVSRCALASGRAQMRIVARITIAVLVVTAMAAAAHGVALAESRVAKSVPPRRWVEVVCTDVGRFDKRLIQLGRTGAIKTLTNGRAVITSFLASAKTATDKLAKDFKAAGVPTVPNGSAIAAGFAESIKSLRATFDQSTRSASVLPTNDPTAFADDVEILGDRLKSADSGLDVALSLATTRSPAPALAQAFRTTLACTTLG